MEKLSLKPLTKEAFAPFGEVIECAGAEHFTINNGTTERYHQLAEANVMGDGARVIMNIFEGQPFTLPLEIKMMERHPLGSQAFMPLDRRAYVVVVAQNGKDNHPKTPQAFLASPQQGVNYAVNTWHHPLISLEAVSQFLVVDRGGEGDNLEEIFFKAPYLLEL